MDGVHPQEIRIPPAFLEAFAKEPRFVLSPFPGLWPVDIDILKSGLLEKLLDDKEFAAGFNVMIVPR